MESLLTCVLVGFPILPSDFGMPSGGQSRDKSYPGMLALFLAPFNVPCPAFQFHRLSLVFLHTCTHLPLLAKSQKVLYDQTDHTTPYVSASLHRLAQKHCPPAIRTSTHHG